MKINEEEFLGDGLFVKYDGFSLWLRAPRGIGNDHYVALEPAVFAAFMRFVEDNTELLDKKPFNVNRAEVAEGKIKTLASAIVKFAPDIATMISEHWIKTNKDADEALKQFIEVLREAK